MENVLQKQGWPGESNRLVIPVVYVYQVISHVKVGRGGGHGAAKRHPFLDASSHFCKRVCPSVGSSVRRSVGNAFF